MIMIKKVLLVGGSGFIGRHVAAKLASHNIACVVPTRRRSAARALLPLPQTEVLETRLDATTLAPLVASCDAVVNLVGILHGAAGRADDPYGPDFAKAHIDLAVQLALACEQAGGRRFIQVSALGVTDDGKKTLPSRYLRSKAAAEQVIRQNKSLAYTIFRPSVVFGEEDKFLNLFAKLQAFTTLIPLAKANTKFAPIYVGDVAQAIVNALLSNTTVGQTYELVGSEQFTLAQLVQLAGKASGHPRRIVGLPDWMGRLQAQILQALPGPTLMSVDNFDSMAIDNIASPGALERMKNELGVVPIKLSEKAPAYLKIHSNTLDVARANVRRLQ
jgi:uncharacterized protein YbjT (DUF2867 family)